MKKITVQVFSQEAEAVSLEPGQKIPDEAMATFRNYRMEIPDDEYQDIKEKARENGVTIQEQIFSDYRYRDEFPESWNER